jgi:hypothetical protein
MEAEDIRHNLTGSDTEVLEYWELDELISNVEIGEKENQSPDQTDKNNPYWLTLSRIGRVVISVLLWQFSSHQVQ